MNARYNIKKRRVPKFCQTIIVDLKGQVIESCDTLFSFSLFSNTNVVQWFDFMESVFPSILEMKVGDEEIGFTKIHAPCEILPGFYDFTFSKIKIENTEYILWYTYDYTHVYQELLEYQQKKNELDIQRQYFEYKNRNITEFSDIRKNKNFFENHLEENLHSEYFMIFQQIVSNNNNGLSKLLELHGMYDKLSSVSKGLNNSITKIGQEVDAFLADDKEEVEEPFQLNSIRDQIEDKLSANAIKHEVNYKSKIENTSKFTLKQNVLLHIIYGLILNSHSLNCNKETSILFSLEQIEGQSFLKTTFSEDTDHKKTTELNIIDLYLRLTFLKALIDNHGGNIHTTYEEGSYVLTILVTIPIKLF